MKELAAMMGVSASYLVADCERGQAVDSEDAGEGRGGAGRGPRIRGSSTGRAA